MPHIVRVLVVLLSVVFLPGLAARGDRTARADPPVPVSRPVTDGAGVLGDRRAQVEAAVAGLRDRYGVRLYVVYVGDFSGLPAKEWASQTALRSRLGRFDLLLAVSVGQRRYAVSADSRFPLSAGELDAVAATAIEPALRRGDWAAAATGAAAEYGAALADHGKMFAEIGAGRGALAALSGLAALVLAASLSPRWRRIRRHRPRRP
ncbi:TPM domain-containing protein [Streptosporangium sp. NPDC051022]|uniref:TPM domain-containing protein n=1 Tax=Streptosporangium sp. NPDC051022 TaxID=3155752 RepID=UPI00343FF870